MFLGLGLLETARYALRSKKEKKNMGLETIADKWVCWAERDWGWTCWKVRGCGWASAAPAQPNGAKFDLRLVLFLKRLLISAW